MIIVAGHVCLDLIPTFPGPASLDPGTLVRVGKAVLATGGVSNTGVALHRLGSSVRLIHKTGDDLFGSSIRSILTQLSSELASGVETVIGETTSYSIVISPPGVDRMFIHCPGANDTFSDADVPEELLVGAKRLHFGYPPIMRAMYCDGGAACRRLLDRARSQDIETSLDLCSVDPDSEAGRVDWHAWLNHVLPAVDLFTPSFDELAQMLGADPTVNRANAEALARRCLSLGCSAVLMKLGHHGLMYVDAERLRHQPCLKVKVVSTTGAGDCTIAGFLAGREMGRNVEDAMKIATAVGACCCESADATSGVKHLIDVEARLAKTWPSLSTTF